jgi:TolA-binding protein
MGLAEQFRAQGDEAARTRTLEYLIERYPSSREAERARLELGADREATGS